MEFKPYVWIPQRSAEGTQLLRPKLDLIQGGRPYLGREDSLQRAIRTLEEKNETTTDTDPK